MYFIGKSIFQQLATDVCLIVYLNMNTSYKIVFVFSLCWWRGGWNLKEQHINIQVTFIKMEISAVLE